MRKIFLITVLFSQVVFGVGPQPGAKGLPTGKVVQLVGTAKAAERGLNYGDLVYAGEVIRTDGGSRVKILMTDRSIIDVGEDSAIRIRNYPANLASDSPRELELELGSMRTSVKKSPSGKGKFFIRTKSSVLAVRGTELVTTVGRENSKLDVVVFEGEVQVDKTLLIAGQRFSQQLGMTGEVRNLSFKEKDSLRNLAVTEVAIGDLAAQGVAQDNSANRHTASLGNFDTRLFIPKTTKHGEFGYSPASLQNPYVPVSLVVRFKVN